SRFSACGLPAEHRQPCHTPGDDAAKRDAVGQPIGRGETQFLDPAAGLQGPEEGLDLPAQSIPLEFMHRVRMGRDGQVRDQFPENGRPAFWWIDLLGMDDLELRTRKNWLAEPAAAIVAV